MARLVQLEECLPDPPLFHSKTCRGERRGRLMAHANTRTSSQLHVVAATAAPSQPELGDTKIIFDGERVTGAHPAPSRPPAMSPIPPQVQHAGNTPATPCTARMPRTPARLAAALRRPSAVGLCCGRYRNRRARCSIGSRRGWGARPPVWNVCGRVCASEQRSPQIARCFSQFVACALVVPACQGRLRHSQRCTTVAQEIIFSSCLRWEAGVRTVRLPP